MVAPINSIKHIVQQTLSVAAAGVAITVDLANAVVVTSSNLANEVREGSVIKAIFVELWLRGGDDAAGSTYIWTLEKLPSGLADPVAGNMASLFTYPNKKNIFHISQGLINDDSSVAVPVFKGWIKIPKGKQRFGLGDKLVWTIFSQSGGTDFCGQSVYKEYF